MSKQMAESKGNSARIRELEEKAEQFQAESKLSDCLTVLEEILNLKREEFGEESEHYQSTSHKLAEICNIIAMIFLNKDKAESCLEFLKRAEILATGSPLFKAITYNNFASYCKKTNKVKTAIQYLEKAMDIEIKQGNPMMLADTHLNLCAVLSQQDKHAEALEHILIAVVLLQDEYNQRLLTQLQAKKENSKSTKNANESQDLQKGSGGDKEGEDKKKKVEGDKNNGESSSNKESGVDSEDLYSRLAIAYHNLGVEFEFMKRLEESIQTYEKSVEFARENLGPQHELTKQFELVLEQASQTISDAKQKEIQKKKPATMRTTHAMSIYPTLDSKKNSNQGGGSGAFKPTSTVLKSKQSQEYSNQNNFNRQRSQEHR